MVRHAPGEPEIRGLTPDFPGAVSVSVSARDGIVALGKGPYALRPVSQQSPQGFPPNSANICLVEHRSFSTLEDGMSAASFLHSSFLQAINAVMLWLVRIEKVPQASEHLCPAKLQTRCDICRAGHSRQCVPRFSGSSLVVGLELNWAFFPVPYLLELCETAHMLD